MKNIIQIETADKKYIGKDDEVLALTNINLNFELGKFYAIIGHSGSGKSTLLNIIAFIERLTSGNYYFNDKNVEDLTKDELAKIRMENIGYIFQNFNLDPNLTAIENVMLPMLINKQIKKSERREKAKKLLELVNMQHRAKHFPKALSGGEQQRVSIARALANNPNIIIADEPTGNLDKKNEKVILEILKDLSNQGKCVIVATHSSEIEKYADNLIQLEEGKVVKNEYTR